ncbi:ABC transporter ATP-binding protein [Amycolatopsis jiangsuensis]|uniref:ABC-type multidrug transport system fused ATPase/permease subunit n=1 Tax=Amycolatopsis jiangsuensis TaxID=1181879 RepID=A0A840J1L4_9PSEU|nr:ABC transporter ATP-binding protein [Amycolatopsis jiangsuensis]MBB4687535.1 ABC-type multidrug transport system fused ATPase/permease subunit [Amycolatopsis jiangsuensis]
MLSATYRFPDLRLPARPTAGRYLVALLRSRPWLVLTASVTGALWSLPTALLPLVIGRGVDAIAAHDTGVLWRWALVAGGLGLVQAGFGTWLHFTSYGMWLHGAGTTQRTVTEHTTRLGAKLREATTTGNVVAVTSSDMNWIGNACEVVGRTVGSIVAFAVIGVAMLGTSPLLGVVALVGVPLAVVGIGPLLAPLQKRKGVQRENLSEVNSLGADIVSGLRILRGVGGERRFLRRFHEASQTVRRSGVEVGRSEAWLAAAEIVLPGLVTVAITWLGARLALDGTIGVGELVAFYGISAFLVVPVSTATEAVSAWSSGTVSARKVCGLLALRPDLTDPAEPLPLPDGPLELVDTSSGIRIAPGRLTVVDLGAEAQAIAERMARFTDPAEGEQVLVGEVPTDRVALAELRARVVYAHNQDLWFSGVLREQLTPPAPSEVDIFAALHASDAEDIVEALPRGVDELIGERGREVSGGQRQRLSLARALAIDADVLLLDEPTSAVDAHTEARITERVARLRRGQTTVVFSQSPLWRNVADEVVHGKAVTV